MNKSILSFLLFSALLPAATVSVSFVNAGTPVVSGYGFDVGPYTLSVNGQNMAAMCMDDFNETSGSWIANETAVSGADFSGTYLGNGTHTVGGSTATSSQIYSAQAYLFSLITQSGADRADIQEAAWSIMDPTTLAKIYSTNNTAVENYLSLAASNSPTFNTSGYEILSQVNPGSTPQQEFMTYTPSTTTPEPATFALFGIGVFATGAFRLARRTRLVQTKA
jgi:hypothetical protein